jgi:hypothetical protein
MKSLVCRIKFAAPANALACSVAPGICVQRVGSAIRIDLGERPNGRKSEKFAVKFAVMAKFAV